MTDQNVELDKRAKAKSAIKSHLDRHFDTLWDKMMSNRHLAQGHPVHMTFNSKTGAIDTRDVSTDEFYDTSGDPDTWHALLRVHRGSPVTDDAKVPLNAKQMRLAYDMEAVQEAKASGFKLPPREHLDDDDGHARTDDGRGNSADCDRQHRDPQSGDLRKSVDEMRRLPFDRSYYHGDGETRDGADRQDGDLGNQKTDDEMMARARANPGVSTNGLNARGDQPRTLDNPPAPNEPGVFNAQREPAVPAEEGRNSDDEPQELAPGTRVTPREDGAVVPRKEPSGFPVAETQPPEPIHPTLPKDEKPHEVHL